MKYKYCARYWICNIITFIEVSGRVAKATDFKFQV